jgi:hypothetical protein
VVSVTDPYDRILGFLDLSHYPLTKAVLVSIVYVQLRSYLIEK